VSDDTVSLEGELPSGLATMLADLLRANLAAHPSRVRMLRDSVATLEAADAGVITTLQISSGGAVLGDGAAARAPAPRPRFDSAFPIP